MMRVAVVILVITVGLGGYNVKKVFQKLKNKIEVKVFVKDTKEMKKIKRKIEKIEGIKEVTILQQQEVVNEFKERFKIEDKLFKGSLPPVINIKLKAPTEMKKIVEKIEGIKNIEEVVYPKRYLTILLKVEKIFNYSIWGMGGLVFIIIISLLWMGGELERKRKEKGGVKFSLMKGIEMCGITGAVVVIVYLLTEVFKENPVIKKIELPSILWSVIFVLSLGGLNFLVTLHKR
jgi:hypothetical protein